MTLAPRSLVARITWLVGGMGALSLVLHFLMMWLWLQPLSQDLSTHLANQVRLTRRLLLQPPPADPEVVAAQLSQQFVRIERRASPWPRSDDPPPWLSRQFLEQFRASSGGEFQISFAPAETFGGRRLLRFDFAGGNVYWRITYEVQPPVAAFLASGLGWLVLVVLGVFFSLAVGVRSITRPMSELAGMLSRQGGLLSPVPLPVRASSEVSALVGAFNQLVEAVQRAEESKQHLLAGVSHDLRTPLSRLRLRIETQCEEAMAVALSGDLQVIERIVSQFLAYVQGESRGALGEPEPVTSLIEQVVAGYDMQQVSWRSGEVAAELPDLAVHRLLGNLIDNALTHGRPPVEVTLARRDDDGVSLGVLSVWDSGGGLSDATFSLAQRPFVRLASSKSSMGNCGLGLAIVARIAKQLGAELRHGRDEQGRYGISLTWPLPKLD